MLDMADSYWAYCSHARGDDSYCGSRGGDGSPVLPPLALPNLICKDCTMWPRQEVGFFLWHMVHRCRSRQWNLPRAVRRYPRGKPAEDFKECYELDIVGRKIWSSYMK